MIISFQTPTSEFCLIRPKFDWAMTPLSKPCAIDVCLVTVLKQKAGTGQQH